MKMTIDLRSALLGLAAGVLLTFTLGAANIVEGPVGRFQITGTHSHALVLDTTTGQVWSAYVPMTTGSTDRDFKWPKLRPVDRNAP